METTALKKRKVHSAQFKAQVGIDAVRGMRTITEIAESHGVHPVMVSQWKKEILGRADTLFEGKRGPKASPGHGDQRRLWDEIARLQYELNSLKKNSGM